VFEVAVLALIGGAARWYVLLCAACVAVFLGYGREHERDAFEHGAMTLIWGFISVLVLAPPWIAGAALVGLVT
jgi:hypothetical protein